MDLLELHNQIHETIDQIDEKLDSQGDQTTATRRKLMNTYIDASSPTWTKVSDQLSEQFSKIPVDQQIGIYFGLIREFNKVFGEPMNKALDAEVANAPKPEESEKLSEDEVKKLQATRSDLYGKIKNLISTAENFGIEGDFRMPSKRTGGRGPRGPRATTYITWTIDGDSVENLKAVAELYPQYEKVKDLTAAIKESGVNLTTPEKVSTFNLPDGKVLTGTYNPPSEDDSDDDSDDDDDE